MVLSALRGNAVIALRSDLEMCWRYGRSTFAKQSEPKLQLTHIEKKNGHRLRGGQVRRNWKH